MGQAIVVHIPSANEGTIRSFCSVKNRLAQWQSVSLRNKFTFVLSGVCHQSGMPADVYHYNAVSLKSILESEKFNVFFDKFTNCATTRAADGLNNFFHRIARQKKLLTINAGSLSTTQVVAFFIHS